LPKQTPKTRWHTNSIQVENAEAASINTLIALYQ
jgi:hypothetical protein